MKKRPENRLQQDLKKKRKRIDLIDQKLLSLLNQRMRLALEIGKIKQELGQGIYSPKREEEVLNKLMLRNKGPMQQGSLGKIYRTIMKMSREAQRARFLC